MDKHSHPKKKINFFHLFKIFRKQVIFHWLFTFISTVFFTFLSMTLTNLMFIGTKEGNFFPIFPRLLRKIFPKTHWGREKFIVFVLFFLIMYILFYFLKVSWEEKLWIKGEHFVKNRLLDKFRQLSFEERKKRVKEINNLAKIESDTIGRYWNSLYNGIFQSVVSITLIITNSWDRLKKTDSQIIGLLAICLILVNLISYYFLIVTSRNEKKYKEEMSKENALIDKESNKNILIDSMGLSSQYKDKQKWKSEKNKKLADSFVHINALNKSIPVAWIEFFPLSFLILSGKVDKEIDGPNLYDIYELFTDLKIILRCLWNYGDYNASLIRINNFLALPEKDDNLSGIKLENITIKSIELKNIYFRYQGKGGGGEKWVLENCQAIFTTQEVNKLSGDNGMGKTTILYLLLGMLKPASGQIIINGQNGEIYNLKDINLQYWREKVMAYFSHDNLLEKGSTGQRQITNININLTLKKEAQIIIFDEATNALDPDSQNWVQEKITKLIQEGKIVIFVEHFK